MSKALLISALAAAAQARFAQEQIPVAAVQALTDFGEPGAAGTLSGQVPGVLLAAANACAKLQLADQIVQELGDAEEVILAAIGLVNAEQNFNPFAVATGKMCADATLPVTVALRGIVQKWDPAVLGSDVQNANADTSAQTPFDNEGLSVAEISIAQGFSNFTAEDADGNAVDLATLGAAGAGAGAGAAEVAAADDEVAAAVEVSAACGGVAAAVEADAEEEEDDAEAAADEEDADAAEEEDAAAAGGVAGAGAGAAGTSLAGVDFGNCDPTIRREGGLGGRPDDEFTFQSNDPNIEAIQQEALNPNIITNRICDELVNQCEANEAALDACQAAQDAVAAIGAPDDRSDATVDIFNSALGF